MTVQAYLQIENNVVINNVMWDGNTQDWQPPSDAIMLITANTQALVWELNVDKTDFVLVEKLGQGQIGFTWNNTTQVLTTNKPKPEVPVQPVATGIQTA
jgi:hypothetical protein